MPSPGTRNKFHMRNVSELETLHIKNNIVVDENRKRFCNGKRKSYNFAKLCGKNVINWKINLIWKGSLHEKPESIPLTDELVKEPIMNTREKEHMLLQDEINRREKFYSECNDDTKCRRFIGRFLGGPSIPERFFCWRPSWWPGP